MSDRPIRIYIAGPMTGLPDFNRAAFTYAWNRLTRLGYEVVSPHFLESVIEIESRTQMGPGAVYRYALPMDLFALSSCRFVVALPGWEQSNGANFEKHGADLMNIPWVAPDYTSDEFPGGLDEYMDAVVDLLLEEQMEAAK